MNTIQSLKPLTALDEMSDEEWESLCDGCGKCCLHKLQDEDTDEIYFTNVACNLLDMETGLCKDYAHRLESTEACLKLTRDKIDEFSWLPKTCAYRLLAEGKDLPKWHPLMRGNDKSMMHKVGASVTSMKLYYENDVGDWEDHIIEE